MARLGNEQDIRHANTCLFICRTHVYFVVEVFFKIIHSQPAAKFHDLNFKVDIFVSRETSFLSVI